jgi:hypothetical protein
MLTAVQSREHGVFLRGAAAECPAAGRAEASDAPGGILDAQRRCSPERLSGGGKRNP